MRFRLALALAGTLTCTSPVPAQTPPPAEGVDLLLARLGVLLEAGNETDLSSLLAPTVAPDRAAQFAFDLSMPGVQRALVRERERMPLDGALPGDGYRVAAEVFTETEGRARIVTMLIDVRRPTGGNADSWRIMGAQVLTGVHGLFRLSVNPSLQFAARNLTVRAEDLLLTLPDGAAFLVESEEGVTGLVLLGRGVMRFTPAPEAEKGQMRIFAGADALNAEFDTAFIRINPADYQEHVSTDRLFPAALDARQLRRAQEVFAREAPKALNLDLRDLSSDTWYFLPQRGDVLAEVRTRRHGALTYARSAPQAEDISLFDRDRRRTISIYPSEARRAEGGPTYNEDDLRDYDVLDYDVEANISPESQSLEGRARLRLRVRAPMLSALTIRLADTLAVTGIASPEYGRLFHLRIRNQNSVIVNLPASIVRGGEMTLVVTYSGRIEPQDVDDEGAQLGRRGQEDFPLVIPEPNFLLSQRSYWYPQNASTDYATATVRITVPEGYGAIATGAPRVTQDVTLRDLLTLTDGPSFVFTASDPVRYLAVVVSRFIRVGEATIEVATGETRRDASGQRDSVRLAVDANPRQQARGRTLMSDVENIMRFYAALLGDVPYPSTTVALVESELPGGHSPGYFVVLNSPLPSYPHVWRNDPAAFSGFSEFFIAHELAHQWWGQAVGWRSYHEQWLSEGFAQYFAALYAHHVHGERVFVDMLRQFRRWAISESSEGPISLGYRLGHIRGNSRTFRALVYNKGAAVLHMLRRLVGDEMFFNGLRRFYTEQKFQKAGTEDLRLALEAESGRSLERFFHQWIYSTDVPRLRHASAVGDGAVTVRFQQTRDLVFDVPVTVSIVYRDGRTQDVIVPVTEHQVVQTIPTDGVVRQVQINRDHAAIAEFTSW